MGLDQYAKRKSSRSGEVTEIQYWRKHNALQGWMQKLWIEKERPNADVDHPNEFNCVHLNLSINDLYDLKRDIEDNKMEETSGFFLGPDSRFDEYQYENTQRFIVEALLALEEGDDVYYYAWY